jgi:DNA-binding CsgD family transcriptional regulator
MPRGRPRHPDLLTPREWQVLGLLRQGLTNAEIAVRLHVSPDTVKTHVAQVLAKLEVHSRQEAAEWADNREEGRAGWVGLLADWLRPIGSAIGARGIAVAAVGIVAVIVTLLILASPFAPTANETMGKLAYVQDGNLWVREMPDGKPQQLTDHGSAWFPRWSLSGEWLSEGFGVGPDDFGNPRFGVTVFRADGSDQRYAPGCYAWSPSEDILLCQGGSQFWTESPEGSRRSEFDMARVIMQARGIQAVGFSCQLWSPDGTRVACNVFGLLGQGETGVSQYSGLWTFQLNGSNARELYATDRYAENGGAVIAMSWDRDSDRVAFMVTSPGGPGCQNLFDCAAPGVHVYEVSASGAAPPRPLGVMSSGELVPGNTPETWLLTAGLGPESWTNKQIARVDEKGSLTYLTDPDYASTHPALSPDLGRLAYVSAADVGSMVPADDDSAGRDSRVAREAKGQRRIWLMNADGSDKRQLTSDDDFRDERPLWSLDGSRILFLRLTAEGGASLWLMSEDGSPKKLVDVSWPGPNSILIRPFTRDDYFPRWFDWFGYIPHWVIYSWWQPR